jgi:transcriptional regulator
MYIPKLFKIVDEEVITDIMEKNSFATFISQHHGEPFVTHLPLTVDKEKRAIYGHFARVNR